MVIDVYFLAMASWLRSLTQTFTGVASEDFNTWLTDHYKVVPPEVPEFFAGGIKDALMQGQRQGKAVLVWLHSQPGPLTDALVREVWQATELRQHVAEGRMLCWAGDVCRSEPSSLAAHLRIRNFPAIALVRPTLSDVGASAVGRARQAPVRFTMLFALPAEAGPHRILEELRRSFALQLQERQLREMAGSMMRTMTAQAEEARLQAELRQQEMQVLMQQEAEEAPLFCAIYESEYSEAHPAFFEASFDEAVAEARRRERLLLVWLRSPANEEADKAFGTSVWPSEITQAFVAEHYLLWVGDVDRWLGAVQLRQVLQLQAAPALIVLRPMSVYDVDGVGFLFGRVLDGTPCEHPAGTAWRVEGWLDASHSSLFGEDGEAIVNFLVGLGENWEAQRVAVEAERELRNKELEEWRQLRVLQDAEMEESLEKDRAIQCQRSKLEAAGDAVQDTDRALAMQQDLLTPSPLMLQRRENAKRLCSQCEPNVDQSSRCTIVVRLPTGKRLQRVFDEADTVAEIYKWVDCAAELEALVSSGDGGSGTTFDVPEKFLLCVTFPRHPLADREMSLRCAGLCPNAVLAVSSVD